MPDNLPQDEREAMKAAMPDGAILTYRLGVRDGWLAHRKFSPSQTPTEDALREAAVERAAKAAYEQDVSRGDKAWEFLSERTQQRWCSIARAALSAAGPSEQAELYKRQLDAVDRALPPWEPTRPDGAAVGRVQTIRNLRADRDSLSEAVDLLDQVNRYVGFIQWELQDRIIAFLSRHRPEDGEIKEAICKCGHGASAHGLVPAIGYEGPCKRCDCKTLNPDF